MDRALQTASPVTEAQPIDELSALVTWSAALFYWAESDFNDSVNDYWDAYNYVATSLSVGYANIFPVTPLGKTIGAVVQMIGPALSARALNGADAPAEQLGPKLDAILAELQKLNAGNAR